jgi:hypothetical protein
VSHFTFPMNSAVDSAIHMPIQYWLPSKVRSKGVGYATRFLLLPQNLPFLPEDSAIRMRLGVSSTLGTPTFVLVRRDVGAKGNTLLTAREEIEFPSLPPLRILKEFIKRRVAASLEVLIRLQPATSSLLASVVDPDRSLCTFNHDRYLRLRVPRPVGHGTVPHLRGP